MNGGIQVSSRNILVVPTLLTLFGLLDCKADFEVVNPLLRMHELLLEVVKSIIPVGRLRIIARVVVSRDRNIWVQWQRSHLRHHVSSVLMMAI